MFSIGDLLGKTMKIKNSNETSLSQELPYWEFFEEPFAHAVLIDGTLSAGLNISLRDIECLDESEVNQFIFGLRSAMDSVAEGLTLQFIFKVGSDYSDLIGRHQNLASKVSQEVIAQTAFERVKLLTEDLKSNSLCKPQLMVFIRTEEQRTRKLAFWKKKADFLQLANEDYANSLEILSESIDSLKSNFLALGINCVLLTKSEIVDHVYEQLNPKRSVLEPAPHLKASSDIEIENEILKNEEWLANSSPREQLVFGDLILNYDQFVLDGYFHKVISLKTSPELTVSGQLAQILKLPFHYTLVFTFHVPPQSSEMTKLQQRRKMTHSMALTSGNHASDLESETKLTSTEELIRELLSTGQRIYTAQLNIILKAPASEDGSKIINRQVREVLAKFRSLQGAEGLEESVGSWKVLKGNLVAAPIRLERAKKMKTNNLVDFLPVYGSRTGDAEPVILFRNRLNGLVSFNSFDSSLPNYNALVTGSSGAGKSFLNNCILLQELAKGIRVFIIDIGGSYRKLTQAVGGQYFEINLNDQVKLNPFHIQNPTCEPGNLKIKSLLAIIECMVVENHKDRLSKLDRALLEKAIIELYKLHRTKAEIPTLSDLAKYLSAFEEDSMRNIAKMLFLWTGERPYGRLLDGQSGIKSDMNVCTFDLKGLSAHPDLQSVMILILTDFILSQVELDKRYSKRIILDEAWECATNFDREQLTKRLAA